jgi:hypothetical protein
MSIDKVFYVWVTRVSNVAVMEEDAVMARGLSVAQSN